MAMKKGFCKICGNYKDLSFEHIPPQSAFNGSGILLHSLNYVSDPSYQIARKTPKRKHPRGLGEHSICQQCNNLTGDWYARDYIELARQGMSYLDKIEKTVSISLPFYIKPLNVLKQMVTMALAMSTGASNTNYDDLRRFVLNVRERNISPEYLFYLYLTDKKSEPRYMADTVNYNIETGTMDFVMAEVALPPLGFVILNSIPDKKSSVTSENMCSINHFSKYEYNVWTTIYLKIPIHKIWSPTPLDYRKID